MPDCGCSHAASRQTEHDGATHVAAEQRDAEVRLLICLGAKRLWDGLQGPRTWVTMAYAEGNGFSVA